MKTMFPGVAVLIVGCGGLASSTSGASDSGVADAGLDRAASEAGRTDSGADAGGHPLDGGHTLLTLAKGNSPTWVAVDAINLYWVEDPLGGPTFTGNVMKVPLLGGEPVTLASGQGGRERLLDQLGGADFEGPHRGRHADHARFVGDRDTRWDRCRPWRRPVDG